MGKSRIVLAIAVGALGVFTLAGCVATATPKPSGSASASSAASATPSASPSVAPVMVPGGTAAQNKSFFDFQNTTLFTANSSANGQQIIDNLVAGGFEKTSMQVTPDKTSINGAADSILFSVKIGPTCLLGEHNTGGYTSAIGAALANGTCLIGKTRTINW